MFEVFIIKGFHHAQRIGFRIPDRNRRQLCTIKGCGFDHGVMAHILEHQSLTDLQGLGKAVITNNITSQTGQPAETIGIGQDTRLICTTANIGFFVTRLGLLLQDKFLESDGIGIKHKFAFRKKSLKQFPRLNPDILGTVSYNNAAVASPERLCMDLLWDAHQSNSKAIALNYRTDESAVQAATEIELREIFAGYRHNVITGANAAEIVADFNADYKGIALWRYFLGLALVFLLIEALLIRLL